MIGGMIGTVVNIVLDPLFILTFGMGTGGAAIATVLGNVCGGIYYRTLGTADCRFSLVFFQR